MDSTTNLLDDFDQVRTQNPKCLNAKNTSFRFIVLFFNCMMTFGSYFCFDMPSVLQDEFEASLHPHDVNCTGNENSSHHNTSYHNQSSHNGSCVPVHPGLGLSSTQYNLLYTIYAWTNALVVIASGVLIDKWGNRIGCFLFSGLCVLGSSTFALAVHFKGGNAMFPLLLLGRLLFGYVCLTIFLLFYVFVVNYRTGIYPRNQLLSYINFLFGLMPSIFETSLVASVNVGRISGNGSLTIVQNRISAYWFAGHELALAFGCTLAFSRLGSVLNFFLTQRFYNKFGMEWTLWGGAMLCGLGFMAAMIVSLLDKIGLKQLNRTDEVRSSSRKMRFSDIKYFTTSFWLLLITLMFFYNGVFPFVADASNFIREQYNVSNATAPLIAGAVYDVSMVVSPFMGTIVDIFGYRGILSTACALLTIPVFGFLAFAHQIPPLVSTIWLGCTYSVAAASLWPSIPLVVDPATIGTAMGITTSIQMIGIGICNLVVGSILDHTSDDVKWQYVMIFLLGNTISCVVFSVLLNISDTRKGGILNKTTKKGRQQTREPTLSNNSDKAVN